jgi:alkylhydroperoxidase/carboxymuconolactone decarboxylase family protein YurZ
VHYLERLHRLATGQPDEAARAFTSGLDPRALALAEIAALVAIGGEDASYGAHVDEAVGAGLSADEIVDVLTVVRPLVGVPRVVAAAPRIAAALGADTDAVDWGAAPG